jgi:peptide/nickel transport system ATP-binding protein
VSPEHEVPTTAGPTVPLGDETATPVLEAVGLSKSFLVRRTGREDTRRGRQLLHAFDDVSLTLYAGRVTALVGESGSGKSTVARVLAQLEHQTSGRLLLRGAQVRPRGSRALRRYVRDVQIVFQDPFSSLNPTRTVRHHLTQPLRIQQRARTQSETNVALESLLEEVSLTPPGQFLEKFPHELSGGQRQRVAVARALASGPSVLLADEPVSMLDVSIRLGVLNLLARLTSELHLALLYITHDIASARYFAQTTIVMYAGQLIEGGPSETVTQRPAHPYTQLLLASAPDPEVGEGFLSAIADTGEPASLISPPSGCRFHPRCPHAMRVCSEQPPARSDLGQGHWASCWLHVKPGPSDTTVLRK